MPEAQQPPGLRPEAELLLWSARICSEKTRAAGIRDLLGKDLDWDRLQRLALHNRLHSLLYRHLSAAAADLVPPFVMEQLHSRYYHSALRNMYMMRELIELVRLLERHGISALPYKGPLLALSLYGDVGLRHFWDLDVLVRREDVLKTKELVTARGYEPEREMSPAEERAHLEDDCELNFDGPGGLVHLEIHWNILPKPFAPRFDPEYAWNRAVPVSLMNGTVLTLPPEELILILCLHGGEKHQWSRLKWIADIALYAAKKEVDWKRVMEDAGRLGREESVLLGLHLARFLLGAPLPEGVRGDRRGESWRSAVAGLVRGRLFRENFGLPGFREWFSYVRAERGRDGVASASLPGWSDRLRYFRAVLRPEFTDRYTLSFPTGLSFLAYLYRIGRMVKKHKGDLISRLR